MAKPRAAFPGVVLLFSVLISLPSCGPASSQQLANSIDMKMVLVPAGNFMMGSLENEEGRDVDEGPQHRVRITQPFYLGVDEVTQGQYERVMGENPNKSEMDKKRDTSRLPVVNVSWTNAVEFCHRLSKLPEERSAGREYRLPTEAEWEYACRAGTSTPYTFGLTLSPDRDANSGSFGESTGIRSDDVGSPIAVGTYRANAWGLHDMHGNVWEWCEDRYGEDYYASSPTDDPPGPATGSDRVLRGGSFGYSPWVCRSACRAALDEGRKESYLGFRVVAVLSGK